MCTARAYSTQRESVSGDIQSAWAVLEYKASSVHGNSLPQALLRHVPAARRLSSELSATAASFAASYQLAIERDPIRTKALTSFVGLVVADCIAQFGEGRGFDLMRTAHMGFFGLVLHGPMGHYWYRLLDARVMPDAGNSSPAVVAKMTVDQALFAPLSTMIFYAALAAMDGRLDELPTILQTKLVSTVVAGYALWPAAHLINFKFVPAHQRMLYVNAVNLVWTVFLSRMANAPAPVPIDMTLDGAMPPPPPYTTIPVLNSAVGGMPTGPHMV